MPSIQKEYRDILVGGDGTIYTEYSPVKTVYFTQSRDDLDKAINLEGYVKADAVRVKDGAVSLYAKSASPEKPVEEVVPVVVQGVSAIPSPLIPPAEYQKSTATSIPVAPLASALPAAQKAQEPGIVLQHLPAAKTISPVALEAIPAPAHTVAVHGGRAGWTDIYVTGSVMLLLLLGMAVVVRAIARSSYKMPHDAALPRRSPFENIFHADALTELMLESAGREKTARYLHKLRAIVSDTDRAIAKIQSESEYFKKLNVPPDVINARFKPEEEKAIDTMKETVNFIGTNISRIRSDPRMREEADRALKMVAEDAGRIVSVAARENRGFDIGDALVAKADAVHASAEGLRESMRKA